MVTTVTGPESVVDFIARQAEQSERKPQTPQIDFGEIVHAHLHDRLKKYGQEHVLQFWGELTIDEQEALAADILAVDLEQVAKLHQEFQQPHATQSLHVECIESPPSVRPGDPTNRISPEVAQQVGEAALKSGLIGVVIVAGGQGSRLGFEHPKGMYPIGPVSGSSLFQILIEKIRATADRCGASIPLYLMTSPATHASTIEFLEANHRFGLADDDLRIFCQGTMPAVDRETGSLVLQEKSKLFFSPNGHGGMVEALEQSGSIDDMRQRGIEHLFYCQIDNALVEMIRPEFIGYHILANSELTTQVVRKSSPTEKVGNVISVDGRVRMIEYSDLTDELAEATNEDGSLRIWAGNIAVHAFSVSFLERMIGQTDSLPFHFAEKKVPYVSESGAMVKPSEANAVKFERFIFDLMPQAMRSLVVEVDRESTFAPLKNAEGSESPEWVRDQISRLHTEWLQQSGYEVAEGSRIEISPLLANSPEELARNQAD